MRPFGGIFKVDFTVNLLSVSHDLVEKNERVINSIFDFILFVFSV